MTAKPSPHLNLGTLVSKAGKGDHGRNPSIWGLAETPSYQELFLLVNQSFFLKNFPLSPTLWDFWIETPALPLPSCVTLGKGLFASVFPSGK